MEGENEGIAQKNFSLEELIQAVNSQFEEEKEEREAMIEETTAKIMEVINGNKEEIVEFVDELKLQKITQLEEEKPT